MTVLTNTTKRVSWSTFSLHNAEISRYSGRMSKTYDKIKIQTKDAITVIEGEITLEAIEEEKAEALREIMSSFKAPGFRPGKVPEAIVREHVSETQLFEEGANEALKLAYPLMLDEFDIHPLTYPRVAVKGFVEEKPLEFVIRVGVAPDFKLPNYRGLAKEAPKESAEIKDEDVEKAMKEIEAARGTEEAPFALTDETAKTLGKFENLADLKAKLKENLAAEKTELAKAKRREALSRLLLEKTKLEMPKFWEEDERAAVLAELEEHAQNHKIPKEKLLQGFNKTEAQFADEELAHRAKREKMKMILDKIAEKENIEVSDEEAERQAMGLRAYYGETDYEKLKEIARVGAKREKALELVEKG